jgi:YidC/Oxa1 family membrane protein insertase
MNQTVRYILLIVSWIVIFIGWELLMARMYPNQHKPTTPPAASAQNTPTPAAPEAAPAAAPTAPAAPGAPTPAPTPGTLEAEEAPGPNATIETNDWSAEIATRGGGLASFVLKGPKNQARAKPGEPRRGVNLVEAHEAQPLPLSSEVSLPGGFGSDAVYKVVSKSDHELVLKRTRSGVSVTRTLTWGPGSYSLSLKIAIEGAAPGTVGVKTYSTVYEPSEERHWYTMTPRPEPAEASCYIKGERSVEKRVSTDAKATETIAGTPAWAGINHKYFLASIAPGSDAAASTCTIGSPKDYLGKAGELVATIERTVPISAGALAATSVDLYFGPKDMDLLVAAGHDFDKSVDLGFFGIIGRFIILPVVRFFHALGGNWGIAIILLTLLVKLATLPLTHKQMSMMEVTKRLQPEVDKIKEKYAGDQQRIQVETMKMYQANNHQPLAGCVPMLVQLPIWYALYATLGASFELYNEPFIRGWLNDLTAIDPYYITPILMTATMLGTQALTPQPQQTQPEMKYVMWSMPVMFGFFMLTLPSGLVLYIFTNNVLSILQSLWFRRKFPPTPAKAALAK